MITSQTPTEIEVTVEPTRTCSIAFACSDEVLLSFIGIDSGDGYRPFHPLLFSVDAVERTLPLVLAAGSHTVELLGEWFEGTGLLVVGYGLHTVTALTLGSSDATLAAQVAGIPTVKHAGRPPTASDLTGIIGTQWLNTITGFWYKEIPGKWQQQP